MLSNGDKIVDMPLLLKNFNSRDSRAFGDVYSMYYRELHNYAALVYRDTGEDSADIINDIFSNIWNNESLSFSGLEGIKAYIYTSIRNSFKNWISRKQSARKYQKVISDDRDSILVDIIESEVYSIAEEAIGLLPKDCAEIFKLTIEGWSVDEIAEKLGKQKRTIYNKKYEAICILKSKLSKYQLMILLPFL